MDKNLHTEVLVLGGGSGGYSAAFRAADLGKKVILVERFPVLGGVCLNVGCIPSKALLHVAHLVKEAQQAKLYGITYEKPEIDLAKIREWTASVIKTLSDGLAGQAQRRKVSIVQGLGQFTSANTLKIVSENIETNVTFEHAIIAAGSKSSKIPGFPYEDERLWDSTTALSLPFIPKNLLIVGGGATGLEMAHVYHSLGSGISIVEMREQIMPECDKDLIVPLMQRIKDLYCNIWLKTKITSIKVELDGLKVFFDGIGVPESQVFDAVLVVVGRQSNGKNIGGEHVGLNIDDHGFIVVDKQQRTNVAHIFAVGDIAGHPMFAHKASYQGRIAAEVIVGQKSHFDAMTIPSVMYTDPEVAWMGLSENQAKARNLVYEKGVFPWSASGRALTLGRKDGLTKILADGQSGRILGAGIVGVNAGELLAEVVMALEMGADMKDIYLTIHAHPTLSESISLAAEIVDTVISKNKFKNIGRS